MFAPAASGGPSPARTDQNWGGDALGTIRGPLGFASMQLCPFCTLPCDLRLPLSLRTLSSVSSAQKERRALPGLPSNSRGCFTGFTCFLSLVDSGAMFIWFLLSRLSEARMQKTIYRHGRTLRVASVGGGHARPPMCLMNETWGCLCVAAAITRRR